METTTANDAIIDELESGIFHFVRFKNGRVTESIEPSKMQIGDELVGDGWHLAFAEHGKLLHPVCVDGNQALIDATIREASGCYA